MVFESLSEYLKSSHGFSEAKDSDKASEEIFDIIRREGTPEEIERVIDAHPDDLVDLNYALLLATMKNRVDIVKYLVDEYGPEYEEEFYEDSFGHFAKALNYARKKGFNEIVEILEAYKK